MAVILDDAKIRVTIDPKQAKKELDTLKKETTKVDRSRKQLRDEFAGFETTQIAPGVSRRFRRGPGEKAMPTPPGGLAGVRFGVGAGVAAGRTIFTPTGLVGKAARFAGKAAIGVAGAVAGVTAVELTPVILQGVADSLEDGPLKIIVQDILLDTGIPTAVGELTIGDLSVLIAELKTTLGSLIPTILKTKQIVDAATKLGMDPSTVNIGELLSRVQSYEKMQKNMEDRASRQLSRDRARTLIGLVKERF